MMRRLVLGTPFQWSVGRMAVRPLSGVEYRPKTPKKWVEVKKAKKRARKLLERKDRGHKPLPLPPDISAKSLSSAMGIRTLDIVKLMIRLGERPWSAEQPIDRDVVEVICNELYFEPVWEKTTSDVDVARIVPPKDRSQLPRRPLVVTVMGHVDHGKTTLLDALRGTNVAAGEAGGITQKVSIFQAKLKGSGETITFMDTPGHAAFASIRERGTDMTDVACLVVAADDGIQDQTLEAIQYIRQKEVPFFVCVTKIDKNGADPEAVYMQLLKEEISLEKFGGDVPAVEVSAKEGMGLDTFEDTVLMLQEMVEPRADADANQHEAAVIETEVNRFTGTNTTVLVQWGTLGVGDAVVAGTTYGRIKSMTTPAGERLRRAPPSMPVVVTGLNSAPSPGDVLISVADDKLARKIAENRAFMADKRGLRSTAPSTASADEEEGDEDEDGDEAAAAAGDEGEEDGRKTLNVLLKADLEGSLEALRGSLESLPQDEVRLRFVRTGLGEVSAADVELASDSDAMLVAFNVRVAGPVRKLAEALETRLVESDIIYSVLDYGKTCIEDLLEPEKVTTVVGEAEVLQCFPLRVGGNTVVAAGLRVQSGHIRIGDNIRVLRKGQELFEGRIKDLKTGKQSAKEVLKSMECGLRLDGFDDFEPGDVMHSVQYKMQKRVLWK